MYNPTHDYKYLGVLLGIVGFVASVVLIVAGVLHSLGILIGGFILILISMATTSHFWDSINKDQQQADREERWSRP